MKTKEELNMLKDEVESISQKLNALTDEELAQVSAGLKVDTNGESSWLRTLIDLFNKIR